MSFLDIFTNQKRDKVRDDSNKRLLSKSIEDLIYTLSHFESHTLSAALVQASRIINLLDPENSLKFKLHELDFTNQNEKEVIRLAKWIADDTKNTYLDNKEAIDITFKQNTH